MPSELENAREYAITKFAKDILEVKDNLARGLQSVSAEELSQLKDDVQATAERRQLFSDATKMTQDIMLKALTKHGVIEYSPTVGETFDPNVHESVATVSHATLKPGTIAEVVASGYKMGQRLLRHPKVRVVKNEPNPNAKK